VEDNAQGAVAPVASATPAVQPPAAAPEKPRVLASDLPEDALTKRLESAKASERAALLKELGFESIDAAKAAKAAQAAAEEAAKSEAQKATEERARLLKEAERAKSLSTTLASHSKLQLDTLTAEQQSAVRAVAGDDAELQLRTIDALKPTWAAATPAAPAQNPAPRDTAPAPSAPADNAVPVVTDHRAEYERQRAINPFQAARLGDRFKAAVYLKK